MTSLILLSSCSNTKTERTRTDSVAARSVLDKASALIKDRLVALGINSTQADALAKQALNKTLQAPAPETLTNPFLTKLQYFITGYCAGVSSADPDISDAITDQIPVFLTKDLMASMIDEVSRLQSSSLVAPTVGGVVESLIGNLDECGVTDKNAIAKTLATEAVLALDDSGFVTTASTGADINPLLASVASGALAGLKEMGLTNAEVLSLIPTYGEIIYAQLPTLLAAFDSRLALEISLAQGPAQGIHQTLTTLGIGFDHADLVTHELNILKGLLNALTVLELTDAASQSQAFQNAVYGMLLGHGYMTGFEYNPTIMAAVESHLSSAVTQTLAAGSLAASDQSSIATSIASWLTAKTYRSVTGYVAPRPYPVPAFDLASTTVTIATSGKIFSPGSLSTARQNHLSLAIASGSLAGKILIYGGSNSSSYLSSSEIFTPPGSATLIGSFAAGPAMSAPRAEARSATLTNANVLIVGGKTDSSTLATTAEIFDIGSASFLTIDEGGCTPSFTYFGHTATTLASGKVLIAGGTGSNSALRQAELFNPSSGTRGCFAVVAGVMTAARTNHMAAPIVGGLLSGRVLLMGGDNLKSTEVFDGSLGVFAAGPDMTTERANATVVTLANNKILVLGGLSGSTPLASAEVFDPSTGAFTATGSMATARSGALAKLLANGTVLVFGGTNNDSTLSQTQGLQTIEVYSPSTGLFTTFGGTTDYRKDFSLAALADGRLLISGGAIGATADLLDTTLGGLLTLVGKAGTPGYTFSVTSGTATLAADNVTLFLSSTPEQIVLQIKDSLNETATTTLTTVAQ